MAQSTPTHASGFHLVTVAMTGHAEEMGSTTAAHNSLKVVVLNAVNESRSRGGLSFTWILMNILRSRTYHGDHTGNTINTWQYATI